MGKRRIRPGLAAKVDKRLNSRDDYRKPKWRAEVDFGLSQTAPGVDMTDTPAASSDVRSQAQKLLQLVRRVTGCKVEWRDGTIVFRESGAPVPPSTLERARQLADAEGRSAPA
ncbi:MAG TPA: hypothetical protein VL306_01350 [Methylomirabilota bacterium]|nr:hypothetical protein [Methylomirabilota bacterium]